MVIKKNSFEKQINDILDKITKYHSARKNIFASSSFQTQSVVLLHILSKSEINIPIYFLQTGYHFPETIEYKLLLSEKLNLNVIDLKSHVSKSEQKINNCLLYMIDPDLCCYYNKVQPMDNIMMQYDVWISGVRRTQTAFRKKMEIEEKGKYNTIMYHPLLYWTDNMILEYIDLFNLPKHTLAENINISIGCEPCTNIKNVNIQDARYSRWTGMKKDECGIHVDLKESK